MKVSQLTSDSLTDEIIDRLLFDGLEDTGERGDCILVLGSTKAVQYRVPEAAALYHAGRAPKVLMCGGAAEGIPEAEQMRQRAQELGIPVLQPKKLREEGFLEQLREIAPDEFYQIGDCLNASNLYGATNAAYYNVRNMSRI